MPPGQRCVFMLTRLTGASIDHADECGPIVASGVLVRFAANAR